MTERLLTVGLLLVSVRVAEKYKQTFPPLIYDLMEVVKD